MMTFFWIALGAFLVASSAGTLGVFLLLRRMSWFADALSHAVLPGLVLGFLIAQDRQSPLLFVGALCMALLSSFLVQFLHKKMQLHIDASIGLVYTFLFALGILGVSLFGQGSDLDTDCVLFGDILYLGLPPYFHSLGMNIPVQILPVLLNALLVVAFVLCFYHTLALICFHDEYAHAKGIKVNVWHFLLMGMVALTSVVAFEQVGAVLSIGFFILLPAKAFLLSKRLKAMLLWVIVWAVLDSFLGTALAFYFNISVSAAVSAVSGTTLMLLFCGMQWRKFFVDFKRYII
jgi:manganese/zinc/iron transport system permease protein